LIEHHPSNLNRWELVSVRKKGRYTEWRDWKSGETIARELYSEADEPAEMRNVVDDPASASLLKESEHQLEKNFPRRK
jgi:iduronate 2-sulfatase